MDLLAQIPLNQVSQLLLIRHGGFVYHLALLKWQPLRNMSYRDVVAVRHLPPQGRVSREDLDLNVFVVESCQFGRVTIVNIVQMDTVSALTSLCVGRRPLRGFLKVTVQILLTICLDVEVNDDMVIGDLDVVDLVSVDVL